jgi:hypothetical protein
MSDPPTAALMSPTRMSIWLSLVRPRAVLLAALVAVGLGASPTASDAASAHRQEPVVPAQSARAFGDSIGVNVRLTFLDTSYRDYDTIFARLRELGVRYVGDGLCATCEYQITGLQRLAAMGIHANIGVGTLTGGGPSIDPGLHVIKNRLMSSVVSITSVNEPDISGDPNWITDTRAFQQALWARVKGDPALAHLPVIGPSLVNPGSRAALGDLSGYLDRGNIHPYPGGTPPLWNLADERELASHVSGNKPLVATEIGYHTDLSFTGGNRPATEGVVASYMPRIALEAFRGGIERTYIYTLADLWSPSEAATHGFSASENSFGLLRWDLSRKPAFYSLRNLLRAVGADSAPVASPGGLRLGLEGAGPDVRSMLLRSANGTYALVLWRTVSIWDWTLLTQLFPSSDEVTVALGQPVSLAQRFEPVASSSETARWADPRRIPVELGGAPVVLRLTPPGAAAGETTKGLRTPRRAARCGSALRRASAAPRKRKARASCCARSSRAKRAHKRKRGRKRAHRRAHARWTPICLSPQRRR